MIEALLDASIDAITLIDPQGIIINANEATSRRLRRGVAELIGSRIWDLLPTDRARRGKAHVEEVVQSGKPARFEEGHQGMWGDHVVYPVFSAQGEVTSLILLNHDITKRVQAQEEINRVFDLSLDMLCIVGRDGHFERLNPAFEITLGYTRDELLAAPLVAFIHPEDQDALLAEMERLRTGTPGVYFENRCRCKDGSYRWLEWRLVPVQAEDLLYAVARDVTERKRTEETLRRRNEELTTLNAIATTMSPPLDLNYTLNTILDKVLEVMDVDGGWVQLLDRGSDNDAPSSLQRRHSDGAPSERRGPLLMVAHRGLSEEMVSEAESIQLCRSGNSVETIKCDLQHAFNWAPIKSQDKVLGLLGVFRQSPCQLSPWEEQLLTAIAHQIGLGIENARLTEEASEIEIIQELNHLRSELIANVSHELRTPLGLIKVFCTTLLREDVEFGREEQREFLHNIDEETERLERIVDNLLDLSRMESGRLRLDKHPTDVGQLAQRVLEATRLEVDAQTSQHRFVHDFPSRPLIANVDARCIEQVLRNLLGNAVKYSPQGGTITARGLGDQWRIIISVSDKGVGIPPQDLERVFERFYRVEGESTQRISGAGLGLSVCRGIVEAHGGRIWAESTSGAGSTFYFSLPVSDGQASDSNQPRLDTIGASEAAETR